MSCCCQKRGARNQGRQAAPAAVRRGPSSSKASKLAGIPGQLGGARASAAMRAFLARKARYGRHDKAGT
jgi:hypothetical protein